jgi:hypothetical protein
VCCVKKVKKKSLNLINLKYMQYKPPKATITTAKKKKCRTQNRLFLLINMSSFEEKGEAFWKWLEANGATLSKGIAIKDYRSEGAGRGVVATKNIKV